MNDYEYLIQQLDLLIGFLDVSDEQVYNQIKQHDRFNLGMTIEQLYQNNYENYSNHITNSALLLGFSHFEDFLSKCIVRILISNPEMNDLKVTLKSIQSRGNSLIASMAEEQSKRMILSEKIKFIEKSIPDINTYSFIQIRYLNDLRNCLMHNNGLADDRLGPKYIIGQKISLDSGDIHRYGLLARQLASAIWEHCIINSSI